MMKKIVPMMLAFGLLSSSVSLTCYAQDEPAASDDKKEKALRPGQFPVQKSVAKLRTFNGKPNSKADYYIYLQSASWCGPCQQEMPSIAAEYLKMKKTKRVELILVSADQTKDAATAFVKSHKAKFPVVLGTDKSVEKLVGFTKASGIPSATIVDKEGKVIKSGHGSIVKSWESLIPDLDDKKKED